MITLSICLTDLPKEKIQTASNGKKYINLVVDKRKDTGKYGETHTLYVSQSKEEREAKYDKNYVGSGKEYVYNGQQNNDSKVQPEQQTQVQQPIDDGLPF